MTMESPFAWRLQEPFPHLLGMWLDARDDFTIPRNVRESDFAER
jgi:hypothetical protein